MTRPGPRPSATFPAVDPARDLPAAVALIRDETAIGGKPRVCDCGSDDTEPHDNWCVAASRCDFQLNYGRSPERRQFGPGEITGPMIDDAYGRPGEFQDGQWAGDRPDMGKRGWLRDDDAPAVEVWIESYASMAVAEAVHEALEWFRVDGAPWLDPHGEHEAAIHRLAGEFAAKLVALRAGETP